MKAKMIAAISMAIIPFVSQAQFNILKKVKDKVNQRVERKTDETIDKSLDKVEGKEKTKETETETQVEAANNSTSEPAKKASIKSYAKYDFVPGEMVIYSNDFAGESNGEMPVGWNSNGNGVVSTLSTLKGNWLQLYQNSIMLSDNTDAFTENYTIEYDLVLRKEKDDLSYFPLLHLGVAATGELPTTDNQLLRDVRKNFTIELAVQPGGNGASHMHLRTFEKNNTFLNTEVKNFSKLENLYGQPIHVSIQVQKERLRIWFNEEKLYDLPKAVKPGTMMNQIFFKVDRSGKPDEELGYHIGNIKIAKGLPDTRHKLVEEGKFSTTGILFDVNSANIKPESNGVLKEVADVLKKFPEVKIKIVGHTDSDGADAANLALSKLRSAAVKEKLNKEFEIEANRIETDGKGEAEPVADNKTRQGKAQNRRVEFIKL